MNTVFFDLETTDLSPVGQILNYAFVEVDQSWNIKSCFRDKIKISRLQLPSPDAIVATKTDILSHNKEAVDLEHIAMAKIQKHLHGIFEWAETRLIGYNSAKFDVPYLRTSMIRNGLNPYFGGSVQYGDVLHVVKRLACDRPDFCEKLEKRDNGKPIFRLESVTRSLGLLDKNEAQTHESLSDVLLTIKLAKYLADNYNIDVREYKSYEADDSSFDVIKVFPFVDMNNQKVHDDYCYMSVLEQNKNQSLLVNLKKFEEGLGRDAVSWYNRNTSPLFVDKVLNGADHKKRSEAARIVLSENINLKNFWPDKNCDVENFIFMLPINNISALYDAVWGKNLFLLKEKQCKFVGQLYLRHLANTADIDQVEAQIKQHALYRYGGRMKLDKNNFDVCFIPGVYSDSFHPTYNELLARIDELSLNPDNTEIMNSLKKFYLDSVVTTLAGKELAEIVRVKPVVEVESDQTDTTQTNVTI